MTTTKTQEQRVRRLARREGYLIRKDRRALCPDNHGEFMLVDIRHGGAVLGWHYDASLEEIEWYLTSDVTGGAA